MQAGARGCDFTRKHTIKRAVHIKKEQTLLAKVQSPRSTMRMKGESSGRRGPTSDAASLSHRVHVTLEPIDMPPWTSLYIPGAPRCTTSKHQDTKYNNAKHKLQREYRWYTRAKHRVGENPPDKQRTTTTAKSQVNTNIKEKKTRGRHHAIYQWTVTL